MFPFFLLPSTYLYALIFAPFLLKSCTYSFWLEFNFFTTLLHFLKWSLPPSPNTFSRPQWISATDTPSQSLIGYKVLFQRHSWETIRCTSTWWLVDSTHGSWVVFCLHRYPFGIIDLTSTVLVESIASWWAWKRSRESASSQWRFGHCSSRRTAWPPYCSPGSAALWTPGNLRTGAGPRRGPGCTRSRWWYA